MAAEAGEQLPIWLQHIPQSWSWAVTLITKAHISFGTILLGTIWFSAKWTTGPWVTGAFAFLNIFLIGQTKYVNIPLWMLFEAQRWFLECSGVDGGWLALTCLLMQHVSFFALGNSNSLSSIDLSNAYNGISSYSIRLVGALMFISNWAGPIWWAVAAIQFLSQPSQAGELRKEVSSRDVSDEVDKYVMWMVWYGWFHGVVMCFLVTTCILLRTHLFIWTVFSPKFLFQAVWMGFQHIMVEGLLGGFIWMVQ
jgi:ethanolamine phosphate transferase 2 subunit G